MQLNKKHLKLAKELSQEVWLSNEKWHLDYVKEKVSRIQSVNHKKIENIWFFINQFDTAGIVKLWQLAISKGKEGVELANFIKEEYFERLKSEMVGYGK